MTFYTALCAVPSRRGGTIASNGRLANASSEPGVPNVKAQRDRAFAQSPLVPQRQTSGGACVMVAWCQKLPPCRAAGCVFQPAVQRLLRLCSVGKMAAEDPSVEGEGLGPQGGRVAL
jgi:hypothetical protein